MQKTQHQRIPAARQSAPRLFHGWRIVLSGTGLQFLTALLWMQSYGAYVVLLQNEFGWSKALMSGAFAMAQIMTGLLAPFQGWLVDKFGSRALLRIGLTLFGAGLISLSQIDSLFGFYLMFTLLAAGISMGGFSTVMATIVNWFQRHRSKALAVAQAGYSLGGLSVPLTILCLEFFGWRATALGSGVLAIILGLILAQAFRHQPSASETTDGLKPANQNDKNKGLPSLDSGHDFTTREALRTSAFWFISIGHATALLAISAIAVHLVPHLIESLDYSLSQAGLVIAFMTLCQLIGQLSSGFLGDRFKRKLICVFCMVGHGAALLLLAFASNTLMVLAFALLNGMSWGIRGPLMGAMRADYFGPSSFGKIMGFSSVIIMLGMALGPVIAGWLADLYGSYKPGLSVLAATMLLGGLCFTLIVKPVRSVNLSKG